jgi:hypothetical protein
MIALLLVSLLALLVLSVPVAVAMAASCALVFVLFYPGSPMIQLLAQAMISTADSFPLMAISIAVVFNRDGRLTHYGEASQMAMTLKKKAKENPRSCYVIDKRQS